MSRLPELAARWAKEIFGVDDARPFIAPLPSRRAGGHHGEPRRRRESGQARRRRFRARTSAHARPKPERRCWSTKAGVRRSASALKRRCHSLACARTTERLRRSRRRSRAQLLRRLRFRRAARRVGVRRALDRIFKGFVSERMLERWTPPDARRSFAETSRTCSIRFARRLHIHSAVDVQHVPVM